MSKLNSFVYTVMYKINVIICHLTGVKKVISLRIITWFRPMVINFISANDKGDFVEEYKSDKEQMTIFLLSRELLEY